MREIEFPISESQTYLLKVITGSDEYTIDNYKKWVDSVNFTNYIDGESYALIPALYKRLTGLGYTDVNINKYKGIYKKAFYKNSLLLNTLHNIAADLAEKNIKVTVVKGAPLLINYLKDTGIRSMGDIDIVVTKETIPDAIMILDKHGFISDCKYDICENIETRHSYSFRNNRGLEIDLYWIPLPVAYRQVPLDAPVEFNFKGQTLYMLAPEDFIFQVSLHGASWDPVVSIRWIFDLYTILSQDNNINWNKLIRKVEGTRLYYLFYLLFKCYNEISSVKIPVWVINKLFEEGNRRLYKKHAKNKIIKPKTIIGRIGWYGYSYHFRDMGFFSRLAKYPGHRLRMSRFDRYRDMLRSYINKYVFGKFKKKR
jgi:hypothetical protein